jgi:predicted nucleic acid-binding protein
LYLLDTNVVSEARKGRSADTGVIAFRATILKDEDFLPSLVVGELRRGVEKLKLRGDMPQAARLETWLNSVLEEYADRILSFDSECAHVWGRITSVSNQNMIDKQVAAMAVVYDLTVVTRNVEHFLGTGARLVNPFSNSSILPFPNS